MFDVKIRRTFKFSRFLHQSPFARQWNQNVRSSILIMIVTCSQTEANGSSRSSRWRRERAESWARGSAHHWLSSVGLLMEYEVRNMEAGETMDRKTARLFTTAICQSNLRSLFSLPPRICPVTGCGRWECCFKDLSNYHFISTSISLTSGSDCIFKFILLLLLYYYYIIIRQNVER